MKKKVLLSSNVISLASLVIAFFYITACTNSKKGGIDAEQQQSSFKGMNPRLYKLYLTHDQLKNLLDSGSGSAIQKLLFDFYYKNDTIKLVAWKSREGLTKIDSNSFVELTALSIFKDSLISQNVVLGNQVINTKKGNALDSLKKYLNKANTNFFIFTPRFNKVNKKVEHIIYSITISQDIIGKPFTESSPIASTNPSPPRNADNN